MSRSFVDKDSTSFILFGCKRIGSPFDINMFNKAFTHHGDAHGPKDGDPIMVALSKVTTHGTPHPNDDYYPLFTTWKPVPFRHRDLKFGVGDTTSYEDYLRSRQANRPTQSRMPTIKYVPANMQARAAASRRKPTRRANNNDKKMIKKIDNRVKGVKPVTFGSNKIELMSVKQLEEALLKELKCTVLPIALEEPNPKDKRAKIERAARLRKTLNQTVAGIISALDPYALANMASRSLFKDRNADAHLKTGLRHIVKKLLHHREKTKDKQQVQEKPSPGFDTCQGCKNKHYTHTCNRKRRVAHCCSAIKTGKFNVPTEEQDQDRVPHDEVPNLVTPDQTQSQHDQDQTTTRTQTAPNIGIKTEPDNETHQGQQESVNTTIEALQSQVEYYDAMLKEAMSEISLMRANERRNREPSQDQQEEECSNKEAACDSCNFFPSSPISHKGRNHHPN